ncbi:MAG: putative transporter [Rikenellaceae bacterium]
MDFIRTIFFDHSPFQAIIVISMIAAVGMICNRIKIFGASLGVTFVFFVGILVGHLGFTIDPVILSYAQSLGLVIFVYSLGLQVGPGFFASMRSGGGRLQLLGVTIVLGGTLFAIAIGGLFGVDIGDVAGLLCGATTNTPALGAAQQTLKDMGFDSSSVALACALTYPLGVVGVIFSFVALRRWYVRPEELPKPDAEYKRNIFIASFKVTNPGIFGKCIREIAAYNSHKFVISRIWRNGDVSIPTSDIALLQGDQILVVTTPEDLDTLTVLFGQLEEKNWNELDIDWSSIDSQLQSQHIVITRPQINGKKLSSLRLRNNYGVNISRVSRSGVQLIPSPDLVLQVGDRLTVVGEQTAIHNVKNKLGNAVKILDEPHLMPLFVGLFFGVILGMIPIAIPGVALPVKLGLAGGPIIVGILIGTFGVNFHMVTYTTQSANLMLRGVGLAIYLACLGLEAGADFFATVMRPEGALWLLLGLLITVVPTIIFSMVALRRLKIDFGTVAGVVSGSMANPMALNYVNDTLDGDKASVSYATVYPLCMFLRVIIAQVLLMLFLL